MDTIDEMRAAALRLLAHLPADEIARREARIERILSDYDFAIDIEDIAVNNPVHLLLEYLEAFVDREKSDRVEAEWFAVLALFLISHLEDHDDDEAYFHFVWHAINTAVVSDERAAIVQYRMDA
ncbi:MAG: hypothetical protein PVF50_10925 [Gammaproteobacteria bacterium]|jgi:hypothetical protein